MSLRALALAAALVGWSFIGLRLPTVWRSPVQAVAGALLVWITRAPLGFRAPQVWSGLRSGSVAAAVVSAAIGASTPVPIVRLSMAARELPPSVPSWLGLQIPIGTVWAEEAAFRAALGVTAARAFGTTGGRLLQAGAFGLSHIADARATGEPVVPVALVTAVAGWVFGWLAERSGSLAAPMLAHLAINESGAVAAVAVQRWTCNGSHALR
ncbi:CAAX protease family protein [Mycobacterium kiyosense]|uniref:CAAX protease family protein n=1 Tax=Mycobacterium kiyosense TaxID=2871094 RepID=A0A9P3Q8F9_9MYCO|nr:MULTISPECIES: CPBP family intramembrane glutamic endopeptidase [Mycobacterium]BDB45118.1 CAAX protease family protein [Mycobacterium kiyosense]BDE16595.1 CAAX protease family protein [Mycobacterium sp. 20KCMC460]GLB84735.1 CAAX protease family protein [Mycobacterium kiyosense]GLB89866.1 CAAX protease family protein [Mycobacterium kiyosense]GLB95836.1 CAAX protease family protein [Mycobacterium kiyosense]